MIKVTDENLVIPQTAFIAMVIKAITNTKLHAKPFTIHINGEECKVNFNQRSIGTEYKFTYQKTFQESKTREKKEINIGITFKNFFPNKKGVYPEITDKHLKMLLYFLEKKETEFEFLATDFGRVCGLSKDKRNIGNSYKVLEDLLNIEIRIIDSENELAGEMEFVPLINVLNKRTKVAKVSLTKMLDLNGVIIKETLSRAKVEMINLIDYTETGQMVIPKKLFELKLDKNKTLGASSVAFNILYLESVSKQNRLNVIYNVSTVLGWIGIAEEDYKNFFIKNKGKTHKYYISRLEKIFQELNICGIKAKLKGVKVKNKTEFYLKEQVIVDLTEFKNTLIKNDE